MVFRVDDIAQTVLQQEKDECDNEEEGDGENEDLQDVLKGQREGNPEECEGEEGNEDGAGEPQVVEKEKSVKTEEVKERKISEIKNIEEDQKVEEQIKMSEKKIEEIKAESLKPESLREKILDVQLDDDILQEKDLPPKKPKTKDTSKTIQNQPPTLSEHSNHSSTPPKGQKPSQPQNPNPPQNQQNPQNLEITPPSPTANPDIYSLLEDLSSKRSKLVTHFTPTSDKAPAEPIPVQNVKWKIYSYSKPSPHPQILTKIISKSPKNGTRA